MRILIINTFYYPKFVGGAEVSVQYLAESLVAECHKVFVICVGDRQRIYRHNGVLIIQFKQKNIYNISTNRKHSALAKIAWHLVDSFNLFHYYKLSKLIDKINPDITNTNNIQGISPIIWRLIKNKRLKLVHTLRDYYLLCHKSTLFQNGHPCDTLCADCRITHNLKKTFFKYPDHFIGISDFVLNKHKQYGLIKTEANVVFNAVPAMLPQNAKHQIATEGKITLGYMGRLSVDKGFDYLVDELAMLKSSERSKIEVLFAGKGEAEKIEVSATKLHISNIKHTFLGVVKTCDFFSKIDVLIIPSVWFEPFGRVVIEALACGVPVCMSDRGGLRELYNNNCCWLFTPTKGNLTNKIAEISEDAALILQKGVAGLQYAAKFTINENLAQTLDIFYRVLLTDENYL